MQVLLLSVAAIGLYLLSYFWSLLNNYLAARGSGFPILICPVNPNNLLWMIFSIPLKPIFVRVLPSFVFNRVRHAIYGWEFGEKGTGQRRPGPGFLQVTPGKNELWIEDPELAHAILTRRKDFVQAEIANKFVGIFGPNVLTANGDEWSRQRKLVAPLLNEKISNLVWSESCEQAQQMLDHFLQTDKGQSDDTIDGLRAIAIHVLTFAGYGVSQPWKEQRQTLHSGHKISYIDAIHVVNDQLLLAVLLPARLLSLSVMPATLRRLGAALEEFPVYTNEMLERERKLSEESSQSRNNFMSTLVRISDEGKRQSSKATTNSYLSEAEIRGNLFQFTLAGFDTTANTLAYAVTTLAAKPELQDWILEEVDRVAKESKESTNYETIFPELVRCLALMYETLRLYTPVAHLTRATVAAQSITTSGKTYMIPANVMVFINVDGIHAQESTWGPDATSFRPSRWFSGGSTSPEASISSLITMPRGTFMPWSNGPRLCPGMKMAQVEFVAVLYTLFRQCRIEPVVEKGENLEIARGKLEACMKDSQPRATLQMNRPKEVKLRWIKR